MPTTSPESIRRSRSSRPRASACPGADLRVGPAESLPFEHDTFDAAVAQLVFSFVDDPAQAVAEMRRVTREGGRVAACVWDFTGGMTMLRAYWDAARAVDPAAPDEIDAVRQASPANSPRSGGRQVSATSSTSRSPSRRRYRDFDELWDAFLGGVGPVGAHLQSLDEARRAEVATALRGAHRLAGWAVRAHRSGILRGRHGLMEQRVSLVTLGVRDLARSDVLRGARLEDERGARRRRRLLPSRRHDRRALGREQLAEDSGVTDSAARAGSRLPTTPVRRPRSTL